MSTMQAPALDANVLMLIGALERERSDALGAGRSGIRIVPGVDLAPVWGVVLGLAQQALGAGARPRPAASTRCLGGASKRVLDVLVAGTALVVLSPVLLVIALLIAVTDGRPVLIAHSRIGFGGRSFACYKFRSMVRDADAVLAAHLAADPEAAREWRLTQKLRHDPRVTPLGRILRKTSLDELPQLANVLLGQMSCVGPRPVVRMELARYGRRARHYMSARPGLTGLWQVSGRSMTTYETRVALDTLYVRRWSLLLDLRLIVLTLPAVLRLRHAA